MIKYIDLFSGMGGFRQAIENYGKKRNKKVKCVLTSEIKEHALKAYSNNYEKIKANDIVNINEKEIEDFDILFAGIPCQPFSYAGNKLGFADKRGTLFFDVERILKEKKPNFFIIENVEGLVTHDNGRTLKVIIESLNDLNNIKKRNKKNLKDILEKIKLPLTKVSGFLTNKL